MKAKARVKAQVKEQVLGAGEAQGQAQGQDNHRDNDKDNDKDKGDTKDSTAEPRFEPRTAAQVIQPKDHERDCAVKHIFEVAIVLDDEQIAQEGARRGLTLERARECVLADVECRLFDIVRHRDGVARVGVTLTEAARR